MSSGDGHEDGAAAHLSGIKDDPPDVQGAESRLVGAPGRCRNGARRGTHGLNAAVGLEPFDQLPETALTRELAAFQEVSQRFVGSFALAGWIVPLAGVAGLAVTADPIPRHSLASD
jgi:hypothetical protein